MRRIIHFFSVALGFLTLTVPVYAATSICPNGGNFSHLCNLKIDNAGGIVGAIVTILLVIAIILSLFFLIWGGVRYISSGGDKQRIDQARGTLIAAIVGLIISLLAFFILNIILAVITGQGLSSLTIPTLLQ